MLNDLLQSQVFDKDRDCPVTCSCSGSLYGRSERLCLIESIKILNGQGTVYSLQLRHMYLYSIHNSALFKCNLLVTHKGCPLTFFCVQVHFDGWEEDYDQWMDCDSVDIYPVGW